MTFNNIIINDNNNIIIIANGVFPHRVCPSQYSNARSATCQHVCLEHMSLPEMRRQRVLLVFVCFWPRNINTSEAVVRRALALMFTIKCSESNDNP